MLAHLLDPVFNTIFRKKKSWVAEGGRMFWLFLDLLIPPLHHHLDFELFPKTLWVELLFCDAICILGRDKGVLFVVLNQLLSFGND